MTVDVSQVISDNTQPGTRPRRTALDPNVAVDDPGSLYVYEPDTHRLARGISSGTVIERRDTERRRNIRTGLSIDTWDEPESAFGASYPHNRVEATPNGHVEEIDDTPGNQRYHRFHPSGSYEEINANGTWTRKIVGDSYTIIENNGRVYIQGVASVTVENTCNILVLGDANIEVGGKLTALVKNDISLTASGSMNLNVGETLNVKAENIVMESTKFNQTTVGAQKIKAGSISEEVEGNSDLKVGASYKIQATTNDVTTTGDYKLKSANIDIKSDGTLKETSGGDMSLNAGGTFKSKGASSASLSSGGDTKLGGSTVHINGNLKATTTTKEAIGSNFYPLSTPAPSAPDAPDAAGDATAPVTSAPDNTNLTRAPARSASSNAPSPAVPIPNSRAQRIAIENDGRERVDGSLYPGFNSGSLYTPTLAAPAVGSIQPVEGVAINPRFQNITTAPYEELISRYVRLKDVSSVARARGHLIPDGGWNGLSLPQIVTNLQAVAENVVDKLIEKYGTSVIITSGFRQERPNSSGNVSQHARGEAVDIQFSGLPATQYQPRYEQLLREIPFDQFILEYQTNGNPWMHISYKASGNRRQWFSMRDHQRNSPIYTI